MHAPALFQKANTTTSAFYLPLPLPPTPQTHTMPETASHVADHHDDKPHVAVLANSGLGHVIPLLEFSKRLVVGHGFRVTFLVVTTVDPTPAQDQLLNAPGLPHDLHVLSLSAVDTASIVPEDSRILTRICLVVEASLKSLEATLIELSPRALVVDLFCTQAFDVAGELGIPTYSFFTSSATMLAFSLYLPTLDREVTGELVDLPEPVRVPGCPPIRPDDLMDQVKDRKNEEYRWYLYHVSRLPMAAGIFVNTWEGLEPGSLRALREDSFYRQVPVVPPVHAIGPLVHGDGDAQGLRSTDAECLAWLDGQPEESVVLLSLGSGGTLTREQQVEMAWGLELSQQRFLWIVRKPTDASASAAFFNVGSDEEDDPTKYLPQGFQEKTREVGMLLSSWAAQMAILSHPSIGAFLSHCGWNSSVESLTKGVPMIAWPLYAEQRTNAMMLMEDVGVAIRPSIEEGRKVVGRKEIERVVRAVLRGEEGKRMRRRAREIRDSSVESLSHGGSAQASLAVVCEDWKTKSRGCEEELCADRGS